MPRFNVGRSAHRWTSAAGNVKLKLGSPATTLIHHGQGRCSSRFSVDIDVDALMLQERRVLLRRQVLPDAEFFSDAALLCLLRAASPAAWTPVLELDYVGAPFYVVVYVISSKVMSIMDSFVNDMFESLEAGPLRSAAWSLQPLDKALSPPSRRPLPKIPKDGTFMFLKCPFCKVKIGI